MIVKSQYSFEINWKEYTSSSSSSTWISVLQCRTY